jgi:hypothetical protein
MIAAYIFDNQLQAVLQQAGEKKNRESQTQQQGRERGRGKPNPAAPRRTDNDSFGELG